MRTLKCSYVLYKDLYVTAPPTVSLMNASLIYDLVYSVEEAIQYTALYSYTFLNNSTDI